MPGGRIRDDIVAAIDAGKLRPDDAVMTVNKLSAHYGVARKTAHRALQGLVRDGYLYSRRGSGTFVRDRRQHGRNRTVVVLHATRGRLDRSYGGMGQQIVERFNATNDDILIDWRETPTAGASPEVVLFGNTPPASGLFRLDTCQDFAAVHSSIHPRLVREDALLPGDLASAALPITWMTRCLSMNRDVAGEPVKAPQTWEALLSWSQTATAQPPTYLVFNGTDPIERYLPYYWMAGGGPLYDPAQGALQINEQALLAWFNFFGELRPFLRPLAESVPVEPLLSGDYLYNIVEGPWIRPQSQLCERSPNISLHPPPVPTVGADPAGMLSMVRAGIVRKQLTETEKTACWEVIRYLLSEAVQSQVHEAFGVLPVRQSLWEADTDDPTRQLWGDLLPHTQVGPRDVVSRELGSVLALEFYRFLQEGRSANVALENFLGNAKAVAAIYGP
jgi:ABC-type glycerol-3-phosphate transport system substrate-binding protein